jgi:uncharacterized protein YegL
MDNKLTEIVVILDRSGSMIDLRKDMEGGLRAFLKSQKELKTDELRANLTLVKFDDKYENVYDGAALEYIDVESIALEPRGGTALLDAMGKTINAVGDRLKDTKEENRPSKVVVVIITDGLENSSREFSKDQVFKMVETQTNIYKWEFVYLGANQDAIQVAGQYGFVPNFSSTYVPSKIGETYQYLSTNLSGVRCMSKFDMAWEDEQKKDMGTDDTYISPS